MSPTVHGTSSPAVEGAPEASPEYLLRPEWYQVMYNLAAQTAHAALAEPHKRASDSRRLRQRNPLAKKDGTSSALLDEAIGYDRELLHRALETRSSLKTTRLAQKERNASDQHRGSNDSQQEFEEDRDQLEEFLEKTVSPAAAIMLAGLVLEKMPNEERVRTVLASIDAPAPKDRDVPGLVDKESPESAIGLIAWARAREGTYRIDYNLACFYASGITPEDEGNDKLSGRATGAALESLRSALFSAPPEDSAELARWAGIDPSLEPLRDAAGTDVTALTAIFLAHRDPDPDERRKTHRKGRRDPEGPE